MKQILSSKEVKYIQYMLYNVYLYTLSLSCMLYLTYTLTYTHTQVIYTQVFVGFKFTNTTRLSDSVTLQI